MQRISGRDGRGGRRRWLAAVFLAALAAGACNAFGHWFAPEHRRVFLNRRPDPIYEALYPYYAELCAVSQFRTLDGITGGVPGHAVMYLKGACRDSEAPYPRLKMCDTSRSASDPDHGVGVSVNRWFRNVNWLAVPGKPLFFFGNLTPADRLDEAHRQDTLRKAIELDLYRGIEFHDYPTGGQERTLAYFIGRHSLGSDFALNFSRTLFCSRIPVTEAMMTRIIGFLNDLNREYAEGTQEYNWSGYHDNCVHLVRNSLAAASVWRPKPVGEIRWKQIFRIPVPANEFAELAERTTEFPIEDPEAVRKDDTARRALLEHDWLPARPGALVETLHAHRDNALYDTEFRLFAMPSPFHRNLYARSQELMDDARYVELYANLLHFRTRYERILADRKAVEPALSDAAFRERYYAYVDRELRDVEAQLAAVGAAQRAAATAPQHLGGARGTGVPGR